MTEQFLEDRTSADTDQWLRRYYFVRALVSLAWAAALVLVGPRSSFAAGALLVVYPAWDALANVIDARHNGGLRANPTQAFNAAVSGVTTAAVAVGLAMSMSAVLGVFGVWASLSGLLQFATAVRRWKSVGAQWAMVLSGLQSAVVGVMFLWKAAGPVTPSPVDIAPYAAFGALYFLVSSAWLSVVAARRRRLGPGAE